MRQLSTGLVLSTLAALALAGCGDKSGDTAAEATATAVAPATEAGVVRKAGLWEQTSTVEGISGSATSNICLGSDPAPCAGAAMTKTADGYSVSATCKTAKSGTVALEGVARGDLSTAYTLTSKTTVSGAPEAAANITTNRTDQLRYLGPCPEGMSVGEIQAPEGAIINYSNFDPAKAREIAREAAGQ